MTIMPASRRASEARRGWKIVAVLAVSETVSWGVLYYAFAVFLPAMQRSLGWSKAELTGAFSAALATSAVAAFPVGRRLRRLRRRPDGADAGARPRRLRRRRPAAAARLRSAERLPAARDRLGSARGDAIRARRDRRRLRLR